MDRDKYYKVSELYENLTTFDAVGIVSASLKSGCFDLDDPSVIASLIIVNEAASRTIDVERLKPSYKSMLSSQFVTKLSDALHSL